MNLADYIQRKGNKVAGLLFGVSEGTAKAWRYGYRRPSTDAARRIIEVTSGAVGWDEIYAQRVQSSEASNG